MTSSKNNGQSDSVDNDRVSSDDGILMESPDRKATVINRKSMGGRN